MNFKEIISMESKNCSNRTINIYKGLLNNFMICLEYKNCNKQSEECKIYCFDLLIIQYISQFSIMIFKRAAKNNYNSRKKAIFSGKKAPLSEPRKLVWAINMEGSTFMSIGQPSKFQGDSEVKAILEQKIIPQINKNVGKLWLKDQQHTLKSQVFPTVSKLIKAVLFILTLALLCVLILSDSQKIIFPSVLLISIYIVWLFCCIITIYTFSKQNQKYDYDSIIIRQIKEILCQYNNLFLKERGYVAKCDQWGTWICVAPYKAPESSKIVISES